MQTKFTIQHFRALLYWASTAFVAYLIYFVVKGVEQWM